MLFETKRLILRRWEENDAEDLYRYAGVTGVIAHEYTLVIYLSDTTIEKVHAAVDALLKEFNQSSVLIQVNATRTELYSSRN